MARIKRVAAIIAVLALPVIVALAGLILVPGAPPPHVTPTVQIGESLQPTTSSRPPQPSTSAPSTPTPLPPPPPIGDDGDGDGDDGDEDGDDDG